MAPFRKAPAFLALLRSALAWTGPCERFAGNAAGTSGVGLGDLSSPRDIFVDASDNVFVLEAGGNKRALKFVLGEGTPTEVASNFDTPFSIAVEEDGNILVAEKTPNKVSQGQAGAARTVFQDGLLGPVSVAIAPDGGVLIAEGGTPTQPNIDRVKKWVAGSGTLVYDNGVAIDSMKVDSEGGIYIVEDGGTRFVVLAPNGDVRRVVDVGQNPTSVAADRWGNLFISERNNNDVLIFANNSATGTVLVDALLFPISVALDRRQEHLYVVDSYLHQVLKCELPTTTTTSFSTTSRSSTTSTATSSSTSSATSSSTSSSTTSSTVTKSTSSSTTSSTSTSQTTVSSSTSTTGTSTTTTLTSTTSSSGTFTTSTSVSSSTSGSSTSTGTSTRTTSTTSTSSLSLTSSSRSSSSSSTTTGTSRTTSSTSSSRTSTSSSSTRTSSTTLASTTTVFTTASSSTGPSVSITSTTTNAGPSFTTTFGASSSSTGTGGTAPTTSSFSASSSIMQRTDIAELSNNSSTHLASSTTKPIGKEAAPSTPALASLGSSMVAVLPQLQEIVGGMSGTSLINSGRGWYGNQIQVGAMDGGRFVLSSKLEYTQQCTGHGSRAGVADVVYFTCKVNAFVWVAGAYSTSKSIKRFLVDDLEGGNAWDPKMLWRHIGHKNGLWSFAKQVYGGDGPSINRVMVVPSPAWTLSSSSVGQTRLEQGDGHPVDKLLYVTWAGEGGYNYTDEDFAAVSNLAVAHFPHNPPVVSADAKLAGNLLDAVEDVTAALLADLAGSNATWSTTKAPNIDAAIAARLGEFVAAKRDPVTLDLAREVAVSLPLSAFASIEPPPGDELTVTAVAFDEATIAGMAEDGDKPNVVAVVNVDLQFLQSGKKVDLAGLAEPIAVTLPVNTTSNLQCVFWHNESRAWSTEGVWASPTNKPGYPFTCLTSHLSLFGALWTGFVSSFGCLQLTLMNSEAMAEMLKAKWTGSRATRMMWGLLSTLTLFFLVGALLDWHHVRTSTWNTSFLLVPLNTDPPRDTTLSQEPAAEACEEEEPEEAEAAEAEGGKKATLRRAGGLLVAGCGCICRQLVSGSAARDALDDIVSSWWAQFADVRSFLESVCEGMELGVPSLGDVSAGTFGRCTGMFIRMTCNITLSTCRHLTAADMGVSEEVVVCVLSDEIVRDLCTEHNKNMRAAQVSNPRGIWLKETSPEVWTSLLEQVSHHMTTNMFRFTKWVSMPRLAAVLLCYHSPLGHLWSFDIYMTRKMRALLFSIGVVGSLFLCTVFFQASGYATAAANQDRPMCNSGLEGELSFKTGRLFAIAIGSLFLANLPMSFLASLHTVEFKKLDYSSWNRQLRAWLLQDVVLWVLGSLYLAFIIFFILLFLANVTEEDRMKWYTSALISIANSFIVLPVVLALLAPMLSKILISTVGTVHGVGSHGVLRAMHLKLLAESNLMLPRMPV